MREHILGRARLSSSPHDRLQGTIVFINRNGKRNIRKESQSDILSRIEAIREAFPDYLVEQFADDNTELQECVKCTVQLFNGAAAIIGQHGAGLTNMLYARVGTLVIELASRGGNLCYMDMAHTLGLQYNLVSGNEFSQEAEKRDGWGVHLIHALVKHGLVPTLLLPPSRASSIYDKLSSGHLPSD